MTGSAAGHAIMGTTLTAKVRRGPPSGVGRVRPGRAGTFGTGNPHTTSLLHKGGETYVAAGRGDRSNSAAVHLQAPQAAPSRRRAPARREPSSASAERSIPATASARSRGDAKGTLSSTRPTRSRTHATPSCSSTRRQRGPLPDCRERANTTDPRGSRSSISQTLPPRGNGMTSHTRGATYAIRSGRNRLAVSSDFSRFPRSTPPRRRLHCGRARASVPTRTPMRPRFRAWAGRLPRSSTSSGMTPLVASLDARRLTAQNGSRLPLPVAERLISMGLGRRDRRRHERDLSDDS